MKALGRHLLVEYYDCDENILNDASRIEEAMTEAADQAGATIVNSIFHLFNPHGVSGVVVIAESHLAIHTWPEYRYAAADIFTCGTSFLPRDAADILIERFQSKTPEITEVRRGLLPEAVTNEIAGI